MHAKYKNHFGNDDSVADAARVSFDKVAEMFSPEQNANLIRFLARGLRTDDWNALLQKLVGCDNLEHADKLANYIKKIPEHWVPFAHTGITLRMSAPVPIRTQCFKHKQGLVESEESRRYIDARPEFFIPDHFRSRPEGSIKQGSAGAHPESEAWKGRYVALAKFSISSYLNAIKSGICPEQARFFLIQGIEVNWVWTGNLYAFANFYNKRSDEHAQAEIQDLAEEVGQIIAPLFPVSWAALTA